MVKHPWVWGEYINIYNIKKNKKHVMKEANILNPQGTWGTRSSNKSDHFFICSKTSDSLAHKKNLIQWEFTPPMLEKKMLWDVFLNIPLHLQHSITDRNIVPLLTWKSLSGNSARTLMYRDVVLHIQGKIKWGWYFDETQSLWSEKYIVSHVGRKVFFCSLK